MLLDRAPVGAATGAAGSATQPAQAVGKAGLDAAQVPATRPTQAEKTREADAALMQDFKEAESEIATSLTQENVAPATHAAPALANVAPATQPDGATAQGAPVMQDKAAENADKPKLPGANNTSITDISDGPVEDGSGN
jgi:hypothetical protein